MNPRDFNLAEAVIYVKDPFDSPSTDLRGVPECEVLFALKMKMKMKCRYPP